MIKWIWSNYNEHMTQKAVDIEVGNKANNNTETYAAVLWAFSSTQWMPGGLGQLLIFRRKLHRTDHNFFASSGDPSRCSTRTGTSNQQVLLPNLCLTPLALAN